MADVIELQAIDRSQVPVVGGKGALLGELSRIEGIRVPPGFCVTTDAFAKAVGRAPSVQEAIAALARVTAEDRDAIRTLSAELRAAIEALVIGDELATEITRALAALGETDAYAVRSSATAEDLPAASFAGQHDSYLDVTGAEAVLAHVRPCWASLFTERAVTYRLHNDTDHRAVRMAVVVQRMVPAQAAGVLFTADPVTSDRTVASVEATPGLGEALVSGRVNAETFTVRDGEIVGRVTATQPPALTDAQVIALVALGGRLQAHLGAPQDIEWCLADGEFWIVQSRPITTLFPIPAADDAGNHVYVSVGHQQMMTEAMRPLGISMWQQTAMVAMHEAGGRLFVDITARLASPASRASLLEVLGKGDPLIGDAVQTIVDRGDFLPAPDETQPPIRPPAGAVPAEIETDPAIVTELIARNEASVAALEREIESRSGPALFTFLEQAFEEHKRWLGDPLSMQAIMAGMQASWWLNDHLEQWLGERNAADTLTLAAPGNVTSEMGLALLDVADVVRPHPEVVRFLSHVEDEGRTDGTFLDELAPLAGGRTARSAIGDYLERYGMRCVGEIDVTRPRWSEQPSALVPLILDNVRNFSPGEARRRVEQGRRAARSREDELLARLRGLPDGEEKAQQVKRMIDRVRTFAGYREYPKYGIVTRYFIYKRALLREAERLVTAGALDGAEDCFYLTIEELGDVACTGRADRALIRRRRETFRHHQALTPPRVLTSDGEGIEGAYRRDDVPEGALAGLPVSSGTVEGRARVIADIAHADIAPGDILVTTYTDPSWTPVFLAIEGLVTEVGGLMTHGAVIAREYGVPAVVGVQRATDLIADGQRIRVHGTDGYVELLDA